MFNGYVAVRLPFTRISTAAGSAKPLMNLKITRLATESARTTAIMIRSDLLNSLNIFDSHAAGSNDRKKSDHYFFGFTLILQVAVFPLDVFAVMVHSPGAIPVTTPVEETSAMDSSEEVYLITSVEVEGVRVDLRRFVFPSVTDSDYLFSVMETALRIYAYTVTTRVLPRASEA